MWWAKNKYDFKLSSVFRKRGLLFLRRPEKMLWREAQIQFFTHRSSLPELLQCFLSSLSMDRWHARRTPPALAKQTNFITFHCLETQYQAIKFWFLRSSSSENELWCSGHAFYPKILLAIKSLFCNSWKKREDEGEGKRRRRVGRRGGGRGGHENCLYLAELVLFSTEELVTEDTAAHVI